MSESKDKKYSVVLKITPNGIALLEEKMKVLMSGLPLTAANAVAEEKFEGYKTGNWRICCIDGRYDFWKRFYAGWMSIDVEVIVLEEDENGKVDVATDIDDIPF